MDYIEFLLFFEDNTTGIILFAVFFSAFYILIYKKYFNTVFDPLFLIVFIAGLATSTVFMLFYYHQIRDSYFYQFIITELSFLTGFFLIRPINFKQLASNPVIFVESKKSLELSAALFYWCSICHVIFQVLTYFVMGLPILMESRMATFTGGGGFGIVGRIIEVTSTTGTFLLFYRIFYLKHAIKSKIYNYVYLMLVIFFQLVSGNKTNLLFLVYFLFVLNLFMLKIRGTSVIPVINKIRKYQKYIVLAAVPLVFAVIYIQYFNSGADTEKLSAGSKFIFRMISFGDIYYMSLPNDVIKHMNNNSAFLQLFKDPLGFFRLVPWSDLPTDCGIELYQYHVTDDAVAGPNARYNYFAILYFDLPGQILYCFSLGLIISILRNTVFRLMPKNIIFGCVYALITFNLIYFYQDQAFTVARFLNILMFFPVMLMLSLITVHLKSMWPIADDKQK